MPDQKFTRFLLLPKIELINFQSLSESRSLIFICKTNSLRAFCPHWDRSKTLKILKKRFRCVGLGCKKVFTENIGGINKGGKTTERLKREVLYLCDRYANMKAVKEHLKIGNKTIYQKHYQQHELKWRERKNDPWPKAVGIDEHSWLKNKQLGYREFATVVVDYNNKRVREFIPGRVAGQLS